MNEPKTDPTKELALELFQNRDVYCYADYEAAISTAIEESRKERGIVIPLSDHQQIERTLRGELSRLSEENKALVRKNEALQWSIKDHETLIQNEHKLYADSQKELSELRDKVEKIEKDQSEALECIIPALEIASGLKASEFHDSTPDSVSKNRWAALWMARSICESENITGEKKGE